MATYQGHKNWNHWNVSLWINNDEHLYSLARRYVDLCATKEEAARAFKQHKANQGITMTPDYAPYSISAIRAAMKGM